MFRTALVKMFEARGLDCVFIETNMSMKKRYHMVYECIPLPKEVGDMAPIYFKVDEKSIFCRSFECVYHKLFLEKFFLYWSASFEKVIFCFSDEEMILDL